LVSGNFYLFTICLKFGANYYERKATAISMANDFTTLVINFHHLYDLEVDAQQLWLAGNHEKLIAKADNIWQKLSKEQ
jgi:hypothetical protein